MLSIKVLGPGCANCVKVAQLAEEAVATLGVEAQIEKVTEFPEIQEVSDSGNARTGDQREGGMRGAHSHGRGSHHVGHERLSVKRQEKSRVTELDGGNDETNDDRSNRKKAELL